MAGKHPTEEESTWTRVSITLLQLLVPGAIVILGLFLKEPRSRWLIAALAVAVAVIAAAVVTLLLSQHYLQRAEAFIREMDADISDRLDHIGRMALIRAEGSRAGWTQERLSEWESQIEVKTIWIAGSDFATEVAPDAPFLEVVRRNIYDRGVHYVYITPESRSLSRLFERLRHELGLKDDDPRLRTVTLKHDAWERMPYTAGNFTIYDPVRTGHSPEGFCWDPGGDGESFIKLRHHIGEWVGRIQDLCPDLDQVPEATLDGPPDSGDDAAEDEQYEPAIE
jgi:hypothetical protein